MAVDLSAIVITRNEEAHIGASLEGCLRAIRRAQDEGAVRAAEVVLSDSASTDRTVEIARRYPITIVQLLPEWPLSAAAGRHVGLRHARGELVLFLDGDYVIAEDWLSEAVRVLRQQPEIAAVCGQDVEEMTGDSVLLRYAKGLLDASSGEPEAIPVGLYRRTALEAAGGIQPFLRGAEDRDLAYRIRAFGYRLHRLPRTMGVHRWADDGALDYMTYFRSVLLWSVGDGQLFRSRRKMRIVASDMRRRYANVRYLRNYLVGIVLSAIVLANLVAWFVTPLLLPIAFLDVGLVITADAARRRSGRSWKEAAFGLHVVPYSLVRHVGFAIGFLRPTREPGGYPRGERVLQNAEDVSAP